MKKQREKETRRKEDRERKNLRASFRDAEQAINELTC